MNTSITLILYMKKLMHKEFKLPKIKQLVIGGAVEIKEDHEMKTKDYLFTWVYQGSQLPSVVFGRDSKASRGVRRLVNEKREGLEYVYRRLLI